jgi:hypothetical protein
VKLVRVLSGAAIVLALAFVEGARAHGGGRIAPFDDPPIAWKAPTHVSGGARRRRAMTAQRARVSRTVVEPDGDPPLGSWAAPTAVDTLAPSLHDTGRIASTELRAAGGSLLDVATRMDVPRERAVVSLLAAFRAEPSAPAAAPAGGPILELRGDLGASALKQCRIEVARRRQVGLRQVAVGSVHLRWIVQANGEVRDAEVVGAMDTDPSVAACVKRVLAMGSFIPQGTDVTVEHTYAL